MDDIVLDPVQIQAVNACLDPKRRAVAVTGKAGSGKTTIIRTVVEKLRAAGYSVLTGAPTGKAARRVKEATGENATTFHRMLEFTAPGDLDDKGQITWESTPQRNRTKPLDCDVVVGDEYAMVNVQLHSDIVCAIRAGARLLTFGDVNQLKPIENDSRLLTLPSKFQEMLNKFDGITLQTSHRSGAGSGITSNGDRILKGFAPLRNADMSIMYTNGPVDAVLSHIREGKHNFANLDTQVITPTNVSWVGAYKLNNAIQSLLQSGSTDWVELARHEWDNKNKVRVRRGDKVVMLKNQYALRGNDGSEGVFNGETGLILDTSPNGDLEIDFGDRIIVVPAELEITMGRKTKMIYPHRDLALAYALTTHKCQGSEYEHVVYVQNKSQGRMLSRANLYTGVTRARQSVLLVSDMPAMAQACATQQVILGK